MFIFWKWCRVRRRPEENFKGSRMIMDSGWQSVALELYTTTFTSSWRGTTHWLFYLCTSSDILDSEWRRNIICYGHEKYDLLKRLEDPETERCANPQLFGCEMNEDVVGKLSRLSRRVSTRKTSERTLQLYLIKSKSVYRRWAMNTKLKKKHRKSAHWSWSEMPGKAARKGTRVFEPGWQGGNDISSKQQRKFW